MGQAKNRGTLEQRIAAAKAEAEAEGKNALIVTTEDQMSAELQATAAATKRMLKENFASRSFVERVAMYNATMQSLVERSGVSVAEGINYLQQCFASQKKIMSAMYQQNPEQMKQVFAWAV